MGLDERDPMQQFYAAPADVPSRIGDGAGEAETFRIARARAGSPLRVRGLFSLGVLGMAVSGMWPGSAPDWMFWVVASSALGCIGSYYVYWWRSRGSLRVLHAWMLALPSRNDLGASHFEWVLAALTIGIFFLMLVSTLLFG